MRTIKNIKFTNNYVELTFDDQSKFKISEDEYFEKKYKKEESLDSSRFEAMKHASRYHEGYMSALNKIKYKDRTEWEIRNMLYEDFDLNKSDVDSIIEKLKRYDFINDVRYIEDKILLSRAKKHGYQRIHSDLIKVRIKSALIDEYLTHDFKTEYDLAFDFSKSALKSIRDKNTMQIENSLRQKLQYRGFTHEVIQAVISDLNIVVDDDVTHKLLKNDVERMYQRYAKKYDGYELRARLFNYLKRRGYQTDMINERLDEMEKENE